MPLLTLCRNGPLFRQGCYIFFSSSRIKHGRVEITDVALLAYLDWKDKINLSFSKCQLLMNSLKCSLREVYQV